MIDYHIHPDFSFDAEGSVDEYCEVALDRGLVDIAFTTHLDTHPSADYCYVLVNGERVDVKSTRWLESYVDEVQTSGDKYIDEGLNVRLGVELDCHPDLLCYLPDNFHATEFDFILGSTHILEDQDVSTPDGLYNLIKKYGLEETVNRYFYGIFDVLEQRDVDVLGHLDIYRRFGINIVPDKIHGLWAPYLDELVRKMKSKKVGFEINTSTWRKGMDYPMPETDFIRGMLDNGIENVTVGSDSHSPETLGSGIDRALAILDEFGRTDITTYSKRQPRQVSFRF